MKVFLAVLAVAAMVTCAQAASLKIRSINSAGAANPLYTPEPAPGQPYTGPMGTMAPLLTPGAKGFLIRIFPEDGLTEPVGMQNLNVRGAGLVQQAASPDTVDANAGGDPTNLADYSKTLGKYRVQTKVDAANAAGFDVINYLREDSYLAHNNWSIVSTPPSVQTSYPDIDPMPPAGAENSGNPGDTLWNIGGAAFGVGTSVADSGLGIDFLYLVTTADARITLTFARGQTNIPLDYDLNFQNMTLTPHVIPEPATFVLAGLGLVGLAFGAWRRRK